MWYRLSQQLDVPLPIDLKFDYQTLQEIKENNASWIGPLFEEYKRLVKLDQLQTILDKTFEVYSENQQKRLFVSLLMLMLSFLIPGKYNSEQLSFFAKSLSSYTYFLKKLSPEVQKEFSQWLVVGQLLDEGIYGAFNSDLPLCELQPLLREYYQLLSFLLGLDFNEEKVDITHMQRYVLEICWICNDRENFQKHLDAFPDACVNFLSSYLCSYCVEKPYMSNNKEIPCKTLDIILDHFEMKENDVLENIDEFKKEKILGNYLKLLNLKARWAFNLYKETETLEYLQQTIEFRKQILDKQEKYGVDNISYKVKYFV